MITAVVKGILDLLFPRCCPLCGCVLEDSQEICPDCLADLPRTEQSSIRNNITEDLFVGDEMFVRGGCFLFFDKDAPVQKLMHLLKYKDSPRLGYSLAREAAFDFINSDLFENIDVIIPVPLHPRRLRERGYNQSEWIAKGLSEVTNIPMDTTHLTRRHNNPKQALMRGNEREANVKDIFEVNHPEELYRKNILLVDDIITTGSTIRSCMETMHAFRGAKISVFALGKARK